MRRTIQLNSISGVTPGQRTIIRAVDAYAYHGILLSMGGGTFDATKVNLIRCFLDSTEIFSCTGPDLDVIQQYRGSAASATDKTLYIPFAGYGLLNQNDEEATAIHLGVPYKGGLTIKQLRIEIDIDATAVGPTLSARAVVRDAVAGLNPYFPFLRNTNVDITSSGLKTVPDIVDTRSSREQFVSAVFFKSQKLTNLRVQLNSVDQFDRPATENNRLQAQGVRHPQANWYMFDCRENGYGAPVDTLAAGNAQSLNWLMNMSAAEGVVAYVETIGSLS